MAGGFGGVRREGELRERFAAGGGFGLRRGSLWREVDLGCGGEVYGGGRGAGGLAAGEEDVWRVAGQTPWSTSEGVPLKESLWRSGV